ncbi:NF-kappa-B inhibitor cactus [Cephus cinctus]|uniref:NF-kappa-B inhibitor cactus n=1 Tax=Cephus cinctus TaxID=211228 RepID=A0AAJ7BWF2_CEPCN|nr:NF-kappa-B inhibitor cactus [Cephus cinctus]
MLFSVLTRIFGRALLRLDSGEKCERVLDSGHVDSGFLSDANLVSSEINLELEKPELRTPILGKVQVSPQPMRADSGVDVGLSESLGQLTIKPGTTNSFDNKVQFEPTLELAPVTAKITRLPETKHQQEQQQLQQEISHHNPHYYHYTSQNQQQQKPHVHQDQHPENTSKQFPQQPWELYYMQDDDGDTQLHIAIVQGFLEAALSLIRMVPHSCLLNMLNDDGQSPLHLAVLTHQPIIVRRLILAGANPALRNSRGNTALHLACATGDILCADALTKSVMTSERKYLIPNRRMPALPQNLEQRNYDGEMCLHVAAVGGHVELVRLLLRLGADLEAREGLSGRTALHLAVERGCRSVVSFLLQECRPCLDAPTYAGITAYQIAACIDSQLARDLIRLGATPEPPPLSDSDLSEDEDGEQDAPYLPALAQLRQSVGVHG